MANVAEELFKSVDILIESHLQDLSYDRTIKCTISDNTSAKSGVYVVTDGASSFEAYSTDTSFKTGETVYVIVPEGDYDSQKVIVSKVVADSLKSQPWVSPSDSYIPIQSLSSFSGEGYNLVANGGTPRTNSMGSYSERLPGGFTKLGITASFMTHLKEYHPIQGSYGLRLSFQLVGREDPMIVYFSSEEMWGDPYAFDTYFKQEKVLDISDWADIEALNSVELFQGPQDKDDKARKIFLDNNKNEIPHSITIGDIETDFPANIFVSDIDISIGYSLDEIGEDKLLLYTDSETNFNFSPESSDFVNSKTIKARWVHEDGSVFRCIDTLDELKEYNGEIFWYRYDSSKLTEQDEYLNAPGYIRIDGADNLFSLVVDNFDYNKAEEKFRALIRWENSLIEDEYNIIKSGEIVFTNTKPITPEYNNFDIEFSFGDKLNGKYYLYNETGRLLNERHADSVRYLTANLLHDGLDFGGEDDPDYTVSIKWEYPKTNSMIEIVKGPTEGEWTDYNTAANLTIGYKISNTYSLSATDNTITCNINVNNVYSAQKSIELEFGQTDICGTGLYAKPILYNSKHEAVPAILTGSKNNYILIIPADSNMENVKASSDLPDYKTATATENGKPTEVNFNDFLAWKYLIPEKNYGKIYIVEGIYNEKDFKINVPIATRTHENLTLQGARSVSYLMEGGNPSYDKSNYALALDGEIVFEDVRTTLFCTEDDGEEVYVTGGKYRQFYPNLVYTDTSTDPVTYKTVYSHQGQSRLLPTNIYMHNTKNDVRVSVYREEGDVIYRYIQPINIELNKYGINVVDDWNGELTIDEEAGTIMATMVGAGKKDEANSFSGVLMGEVSNDRENISNIGLFGFHKGEQSFKFDIDGTAYIGKSGLGRIEFDGNRGIIENSGFSATSSTGEKVEYKNYNTDIETVQSGTRIDFIDGSIRSAKGTIGGWQIGPDSLSKPINSGTKKYAIFRAPDTVSENTTAIALGAAQGPGGDDYSDAPFRVTYGGILHATGVQIDSGDIHITSGEITIGDNFKVDTNGKMTATGVVIKEGDIQITSGSIKLGGTSDDPVFSVDSNGIVAMKRGKIQLGYDEDNDSYAFEVNDAGKIKATSGTVGGWTISTSKIYATGDGGQVVAMQVPKSSNLYVFAAGGDSHSSYANCPFRVTKNGVLYAKGAEFEDCKIEYKGLKIATNSNNTSYSTITTKKITFVTGDINLSIKETIDATLASFLTAQTVEVDAADADLSNQTVIKGIALYGKTITLPKKYYITYDTMTITTLATTGNIGTGSGHDTTVIEQDTSLKLISSVNYTSA